MTGKKAGIDAIEASMSNPVSRWPRRTDANNRLLPRCQPSFKPSFNLEAGESIFTIGSCFARHVERALKKQGFQVPCLDFEAPKGETWGAIANEILNKYTPYGMLNEVEFALGLGKQAKDYLVEARPGAFMDYQLHVNKPVEFERAVERREDVREIYRNGLRDSRVVVITLGLVEAWRDDEAGIYLNETPSRNMTLKYPGRFWFEVMRYEACHGAVDRLVKMLRDFRGDDLRIVMTVSPVPIQRTYTDFDVLAANTYSKSLLRVVADDIASAYDFVDYFPSFESITLSDPAFAWKDDLAHVTPEAIQLNVGRMVEAYSGSAAP